MNSKIDHQATTRYRRLPGKGPRRGGLLTVSLSRCSLYMSEDHILAVDSNGFSEDYKRFYFSDIQTIITRRTRRGAIWSIVLALLIACSLTGALLLEREPAQVFIWVFSGVFLVLLLVNLLRGPTCICHIMTAVQEDQLPSLNRLRVARKVIRTLREAIERAQGEFNPAEVNLHRDKGIIHPMRSNGRLRQLPAGERPVRHDAGTLHMAVFAFLLLDGILIGVELLHHSAIITGVSTVLTLIYSILIIIALVRQHESDIPGTVRKMTWASLGFVCLSYSLSYILMMTLLMTNQPERMITQWDLYRAMLDLSPQDSLMVMGLYAFAAACSLALGILGLVRVKKHHDRSLTISRTDPDFRSAVGA